VILSAIAAVPLLIWTYLLLGRGGFWHIARHFSPKPPEHLAPRSVVAIIPARNEAALIGAAVGSLLQQDFVGSLRVMAAPMAPEKPPNKPQRASGPRRA